MKGHCAFRLALAVACVAATAFTVATVGTGGGTGRAERAPSAASPPSSLASSYSPRESFQAFHRQLLESPAATAPVPTSLPAVPAAGSPSPPTPDSTDASVAAAAPAASPFDAAPESPAPTNTTEHKSVIRRILDKFDYHIDVDPETVKWLAQLIAAGVALLVLSVVLLASPYFAHRLFPGGEEPPPVKKRLRQLWLSFTLSFADLGHNAQEWVSIMLWEALHLAVATLIGFGGMVVFIAMAGPDAVGFTLTMVTTLPHDSPVVILPMVMAIVHCSFDLLLTRLHIKAATKQVRRIFADESEPANTDCTPTQPESDARLQALYAAFMLTIRPKCDPRIRGALGSFCIRWHLVPVYTLLARVTFLVTIGHFGHWRLTVQEQNELLRTDLTTIRQEMGLPDADVEPVTDVRKMKDAQEELERCHAYSKHTKASGASGQLNQRAAAEADKAVAEAKMELKREVQTAGLSKRRPSVMLYCGSNAKAEETQRHIAANYAWLSCERAPLPSDFFWAGLMATYKAISLLWLVVAAAFAAFPFLSFNGLMFGLWTELRCTICDLPMPDTSLDSHHDAEPPSGTGVFCGNTGVINWLLVLAVVTLIPATICILMSDYGVVYLFHRLIQVASGKVSATQQDVSVAYCACAYDILAVTVGILTGGHVGKLFDSWSEHGFGGMMATFGERAADAAPYFLFYIMLRTCVLTIVFKLILPALRGQDLLRLLCWLPGIVGLASWCPLAAVSAWAFPTLIEGGATAAYHRICDAVDAAVKGIAGHGPYYLLTLLSLPVVLACMAVQVAIATGHAMFNGAEAGFWRELEYAVYQTHLQADFKLRCWTNTPKCEVEPLIDLEGQHGHESDGRSHFEAHEYIGVVAMLVYYPAVAYSATAPLVTAAGVVFLLLLAVIVNFKMRSQCVDGSPSLGLWAACSVRCRFWAGLLRLLVTAAMLVYMGRTPLQCLPLLVAAVLYVAAYKLFISPALRELEALAYSEAAAWATPGRVPVLKQEQQQQLKQLVGCCFTLPVVRTLKAWAVSLASDASRLLRSTTDDGGASWGAVAAEEGRAGLGRSPLGNLTNSPQQRPSGHKANLWELR